MKKNISIYITLLLLTICSSLSSCKKDFLEAKPSTSLLNLRTLADYQQLLNNNSVLNFRGSLPLASSDEYVLPTEANYQSLSSQVTRNAYTWQKDLYGGQATVRDWSQLYAGIFYANSVLDGLNANPETNNPEWNRTKGWALFSRAYGYYDLAQNFCAVYQPGTASIDLGLPLRTKSGIDELKQRSTLAETYALILADLQQARQLLPNDQSIDFRNQPSRAAAFALFARIYLSMGNYPKALSYADSTLAINPKLIDYNSISTTVTSPFSYSNEESIFSSLQINDYSDVTITTNGIYSITPELYGLFEVNDLRKQIFFTTAANGSIIMKRGYSGTGNLFTGLATDEIYLIKAECLARSGQLNPAMALLDQLLIRRWNPNATNPAKAYVNQTANSIEEALAKVLLERRKELVRRGLRWYDLKRLNLAGANITLSRSVGAQTYTLPPNDPRYIFPIPNDEISWSGIVQNQR